MNAGWKYAGLLHFFLWLGWTSGRLCTLKVSCSDASTKGGGVCVSAGATRLGSLASGGSLRGRAPEDTGDFRTVSIGPFDGIGASWCGGFRPCQCGG